jgi:hypothetical protein
MGRFAFEDAEHYGGSGNGGSYFKLQNDKEVARVQLLGNDMNDFPGYAVHKVAVDGKDRWVNCLREYQDPVDVCPFCAAKIKQEARLFIPLYNIDADEVQIWERGKNFFPTLAGYCARNPEVVSIVTEIERHGKPHDTSTTYQLYSTKDEPERDRLEDFEGEIPEIIGRYVLDKTADDMEYYLDHDEFPKSDDDSSEDEAPRRRERSSDRESGREERRRPSRRRDED